MLTLLAVLALPMQTAAHTTTGGIQEQYESPKVRADNRGFHDVYRIAHHGSSPPFPPAEIIRWIRVYKNPKRIHKDALTHVGDATSSTMVNFFGFVMPFYNFETEGVQAGRYMYLLPSYNSDSGPGDYWVEFNGESGELLEDPEKPGKSGLVTATDNTSVGIDDIVAIAVHVKSWDQNCIADLAIGPTVTRTYSFGSIDEGQWRLNPNLPLWQANNSLAP